MSTEAACKRTVANIWFGNRTSCKDDIVCFQVVGYIARNDAGKTEKYNGALFKNLVQWLTSAKIGEFNMQYTNSYRRRYHSKIGKGILAA